jgi:BirA family biotin operon repressor/biotin-[acetyl-CoA-carboxylase] ligase
MSADPVRPALDTTRLCSTVTGPGRFWRTFDVVTETGSTNADLLARSDAGADIRGAVIAAEFQTAGRGRHGRAWIAPPRSQISLSAGVDTSGIPPQAWGWLPLATGLAVVKSLEDSAGVSAGLKWPNDVIARGGKLAGILAEVAPRGDAIVIGIGLNVTLMPSELPDLGATSLLQLGASELDRNVLIVALLQSLGDWMDHWRTAGGADEKLIGDYRRASITLGSRVKAVLPGEREILGTARDVDAWGRLIIDTDGQAVTVSAGDITHLRTIEH